MRGVPRRLIAGAVALLLAAGLVACGRGGDSSSSAGEATSQAQAEGKSSGDGTSEATNGADASSESGGGEAEGESGEGGAGSFTPKQHSDSGGGSQQYQVTGGDNSVQDFGSEADASERDEAASTLHDFLDARAEGDWDAACSYMSETVSKSLEELAARAKQIEVKSCAGVLEMLTNPSARKSMEAEAVQADVGSLRVEGERAFVIYTGVNGTVFAMPMASEDGAWKVASLAATPLN